MYVGASAQALVSLAAALGAVVDEASARRGRIAALLEDAGEQASAVVTLAGIEQWAADAAAQARTAAAIAATDPATCPASPPAQTGLRASMGMVDDVVLDLLFVNDINRLVWGRDLNTGTAVGPGGRALSAVALIPFGKVAKLGKFAGLGDEAVGFGRGAAAARHASRALRTGAEVLAVVAQLPHGRQRHVATVDTADDLDAIFERLTVGARHLEDGYPGVVRVLPDGTRIARRDFSTSGGPTIDIAGPSIRTTKVHISPWPPA